MKLSEIDATLREIRVSRSIPFRSFMQVVFGTRPKPHRLQRERASCRISSIAVRQSS